MFEDTDGSPGAEWMGTGQHAQFGPRLGSTSIFRRRQPADGVRESHPTVDDDGDASMA